MTRQTVAATLLSSTLMSTPHSGALGWRPPGPGRRADEHSAGTRASQRTQDLRTSALCTGQKRDRSDSQDVLGEIGMRIRHDADGHDASGCNSGGCDRDLIASTGDDTAGDNKPRGDRRHDPAALTSVGGAGNITPQEYAQALRLCRDEPEHTQYDLSLYIHLPFCPSRCLTCDHHTSVSRDAHSIDRYIDDLGNEIALLIANLGRGRRLKQLHLGGGTPNFLSDVQFARLFDLLDDNFSIGRDTDMSLEANAHRASCAQLALLRGLGFSKLNLELRDLDGTVQAALGRRQSPQIVRDVVVNARQLGFETIATDLVYGLPMQTVDSMRGTLDKLLALELDQISCFTYSRRPERFPHQYAVERSKLPSLAEKLAIFSRILDRLSGSGYEWIGLDCFARQQDRLALAHREGRLHRNSIGYTTHSGWNVVGLGTSSRSELPTVSVRNHPDIQQWRASLERGEFPVGDGQTLSTRARARRHALSDLMCNLKLTGEAHQALAESEGDPALQRLCDDGLVEMHGDSATVTESGRYTLHQLWGDASPSYRWGSLL